MSDLPEIHPLNAPPEIAAIYADIRLASGLSLVNLIWRHFAALPGVLDWAWDAVRPLVASEQMIAARQRLMANITLPSISPLTLDAWRAMGMTESDLNDFRDLIANYVRGNCTNLIALTALRLRLEGALGTGPALASAEPPPAAVSVPPIPRIDSLDPKRVQAIKALASRHDGAQSGIIPSVYLELARWPALIDHFPNWLAPLYTPTAMLAARTSACRAAEAEAIAMLPTVPAAPVNVQAMRPALEHFTRFIIPDMTPVCIAVERLLPRN
jgi:hypothetical protein